MGVKISATPLDAALSGVELIPLSDADTAKHTTATLMAQFAIDSIEAIAAGTVVATADKLYMLDATDSVLKPIAIDTVLQRGTDTMWGKAAEATPDAADILLLKDGGTTEKTVTAAVLAEYVRTAIQPAILDVSDLTVHSTIIAADKFLVTSGTTGKYCTFTVLSTAVLAALNAYVTALAAVTVADDTDVFYVLQGGVQKKITRAVLHVGLGTTIAPSSTTEDSVPQWDSTSKTLKDGLTVQTTVRATASAVDTALATEKSIRTLASSIVYDQTDIAADIVDADALIIDDGNLGTTQRKTAISRLWAYINAKLQGLSAKTTPVSDDVISIQDSADSSILKNVTMANLDSYFKSGTQNRYALNWTAGQRGKPGLNADIQNAAEATRMVTDPDFEILGTNAVSTDITFNPEGGIIMETAGADGDEDILCPHLDANQSAWTQITWGTDQQTRWECRIKTGASIGDCIIWAGLKLTMTDVMITDANQVYFRYENGVTSGHWEAISSIGGSDIATDSGVTVTINTDYHLIIEIQADRSALFYINDTLVETTTPLTDATDLIPYIGVAADGAAAAKSLIVRSQAIRRNFA